MRSPPAVGAVRPRRIFTVVVFPAPFGPRRPKSSPGRTAMSIPSSAVMRRPRVERRSFPRSDRAVFYDPTRRRWWWIKRIGTIAGLAVVVAASLTLISLEAKIGLPGISGITIPLQRQIRRSMRLPRHNSAKLQYLAKKDRAKLIDVVVCDYMVQLSSS